MIAIRTLVSIVGGGLATGLLALLMVGLIRTDFAPAARLDIAEIELAPTVDDLETVRRNVRTPLREKVEVPPAPPRAEIPTTEAPSVPIASLPGELPGLPEPALSMGVGELAINDRDAQPLVRIPGQMPPGADKSGHCTVRFDVDPSGKPFNIRTTFCTQSVFKRPTVRSVERWKFQPKIQDGQAVSRTGVENRVTYKLLDARGDLIPE